MQFRLEEDMPTIQPLRRLNCVGEHDCNSSNLFLVLFEIILNVIAP